MEMRGRGIKSAVVTGPTGAIGIALCQRLLDDGITVYAVIRPNSPRLKELPADKKLHIIPCELAEMETLGQKIGTQADAFFHLAWSGTIGKGRNDIQRQLQNIQSAICAVHGASHLGCKVFVGAGSQAEYGRANEVLGPSTPCRPENGYGAAKLCAGHMSRLECGKLGMDHIWARILSVYGPNDGPLSMITAVARELLQGKKPALTAGEQIWDYLYATDAAEALYRMAIAGRSGAVYPLGSGSARPLREYVEILRSAIDPSLPLGLGEIPYGPQQVMRLQADITELRSDTGFEPKTPFEVGIRETIEWIRGQLE